MSARNCVVRILELLDSEKSPMTCEIHLRMHWRCGPLNMITLYTLQPTPFRHPTWVTDKLAFVDAHSFCTCSLRSRSSAYGIRSKLHRVALFHAADYQKTPYFELQQRVHLQDLVFFPFFQGLPVRAKQHCSFTNQEPLYHE